MTPPRQDDNERRHAENDDRWITRGLWVVAMLIGGLLFYAALRFAWVM